MPARPDERRQQAVRSRHAPAHMLWLCGLTLSLGLALSGLTLGLLSALHEALLVAQVRAFDVGVLGQLHAFASPPLTIVMGALTFAGNFSVLSALTTGISLLLIVARQWSALFGLLVAFVGSSALNGALKLWFHRDRPIVAWALAHETGFSFPSGHAMESMVVFGMAAYLFCRLVWWPRVPPGIRRQAGTVVAIMVANLLVLGIGLSRVYLGVHYPSDVIAGFAAGGSWLIAAVVSTKALSWLFPP